MFLTPDMEEAMIELEDLLRKLAPANTPHQTVAGMEHEARPLELAEPQGPGLSPKHPERLTLSDNCPIHWTRVPELPRGVVPVVDSDGWSSRNGCLYRLEFSGTWYLVKFLPPFDGRLSLTDPSGRVRVFASLDEALRVLEVLTRED